MGTTTAYAWEGSVKIVDWPSPVWFGTSVSSGNSRLFQWKIPSTAANTQPQQALKVWFARGAIKLPGEESTWVAAPPAIVFVGFMVVD